MTGDVKIVLVIIALLEGYTQRQRWIPNIFGSSAFETILGNIVNHQQQVVPNPITK